MIINKIKVKEIITKSNLPVCDYSVNPYVGCEHSCKYCYACFMKRFTGHNEDWGSFVDVKYWDKIKNPQKYNGKELFICSVTDPYQPCEKEFERTKALLEELKGSGAKLSIATKSDLILRDLELIKSFPNARVSWSINTLDENFKNDMDKGVSTERLENLNLRETFKPVIMNYIRQKYPELYPLYDEIFNKNSDLYWQELDAELQSFAKEQGLEYKTNDDSFLKPFEAKPVIVNYFYHSKIKKSAKKIK